MPIVVNGGLGEPHAALEALSWCDGVMLGREAYHRPYVLPSCSRRCICWCRRRPTREALILRMQRYAERELAAGGGSPRLPAICGLYAGQRARATTDAPSVRARGCLVRAPSCCHWRFRRGAAQAGR